MAIAWVVDTFATSAHHFSAGASVSTMRADLDSLLAEITDEFPKFRILHKCQSRWMRVIDICLRLLTLGRQSRFMTLYHTVLGETLYVAPTWDMMRNHERIVLLRHERIHLRQRKRWGSIGMAVIYLIPIFPIGLAYGRARLEWEAYQETLLATMEVHGLESACDIRLRETIVRRFTGPDYAWMWPFRKSVESWYDRYLEKLRTLAASE
jgi:hypothetical protein